MKLLRISGLQNRPFNRSIRSSSASMGCTPIRQGAEVLGNSCQDSVILGTKQLQDCLGLTHAGQLTSQAGTHGSLLTGKNCGTFADGSAQAPSLPVDDQWTSDKRGVCLPYTQCPKTVLNLPLPGILRMPCIGPGCVKTRFIDHCEAMPRIIAYFSILPTERALAARVSPVSYVREYFAAERGFGTARTVITALVRPSASSAAVL